MIGGADWSQLVAMFAIIQMWTTGIMRHVDRNHIFNSYEAITDACYWTAKYVDLETTVRSYVSYWDVLH